MERQIYRYDINDINDSQGIGIQLPINHYNDAFNISYTTNDQARTNIMNLILTAKGERIMLPDFGTNLPKYLFENVNDDLLEDLRDEIINDIRKWVKGVEVVDIQIGTPDWDDAYTSRIEYHTIYFNLTYKVLPDFGLQRIKFFINQSGIEFLEDTNGVS